MAKGKIKIIARFTKHFVKGNLTGLKIHESLSFVSVKRAEDWHNGIKAAKSLDYVIEDFYIENPAYTN